MLNGHHTPSLLLRPVHTAHVYGAVCLLRALLLSVLLGLNGPPTAASVLNADDERSGKQSVGRTPPETTAPSPLRSVEIGRDEPPMSPIHPSKSFAQWRRQGDSSNPISPLPPASMRSDRLRVRFDVDDDDRRAPGLSTAISRPRTQTDEEESTNSDESDGGSLLACDTDRRKMLEVSSAASSYYVDGAGLSANIALSSYRSQSVAHIRPSAALEATKRHAERRDQALYRYASKSSRASRQFYEIQTT